VPGRFEGLRIPRDTLERRLYVDVPEGATRLTVNVHNADELTVHVVPGPLTPGVATIAASPSRSLAVARATASGFGKKRAVVEGAALHAGRWYVVVDAAPNELAYLPVHYGVDVAIEAVAPIVRPGSYFDPDRPGHGLLMYPAGDQIAGLWYTYLPDGSSTWYYLQATAPGADGVWTSPIYRSTRQGDHNHLVRIGEAIVTPTGPDAFLFSHSVDGDTGSEPMRALGRGCPAIAGQPVDASSHWFDPAQAGTGYSVQFWSDYEFHAAFAYDAKGVARFLTAESSRFAGADATLVLEQLQGFCPTCVVATPLRQPIGTLRRVIGGGLRRFVLDGMYASPVAGDWIVDHAVQLLGGPGTTQGCDP
jgi:hypothetical protein